MDRQEAGNDTAARQPRINEADRSQVDPNPKNIDDLIPHDHPARLVWALVQELDMTSLYQEIKAVEGRAGRPATDPRILAGLWKSSCNKPNNNGSDLRRNSRQVRRNSRLVSGRPKSGLPTSE